MDSKGNHLEAVSLTCSVAEFARMVGISRDRAYELVHSEFPPPHIRSGKAHRIIVARIREYVDALADEESAARRGMMR